MVAEIRWVDTPFGDGNIPNDLVDRRHRTVKNAF